MKVHFFEKQILNDFYKFLSISSSILSLLFLFLPDLCFCIKKILLVILVIFIIIVYFSIFIYYKFKRKIKLKINNTIVNIFFGDIFKMRGKKVIGFNEYFDTIVDESVIISSSLNGQLVKKLGKDKIDDSLNKDKDLVPIEINKNRKKGKTKKYQLGTIHKIGDYFLLALTHFNEKNEAYLLSNDYAKCLLEMWKHLNESYAQEEIFIPLLGAGITRIIDNSNVELQELLEIMLKTLEISKLTFKEPSTINIVLFDRKNSIHKFNFAKLKYLYK